MKNKKSEDVKTKVAVVTGANKGLGFAAADELCKRGYHVVMVARRASALKKAVADLKAKGFSVEGVTGDVSKLQTAKSLQTLIKKKFKKLDVLINNAGIYADAQDSPSPTLLNVKPQTLVKTFQVNAIGAFQILQALLPLLQLSERGRVVNISSGMGQLTDMAGGYPAYRMSKAALNALTKSVSEDFGSEKLKINSVCPGWVRTEMGGANATRSVEEGVSGIIWAATLDETGPTGGFFRDGKPLSW